MSDYAAAVAEGRLVLEPDQFTDDGDAYTLAGVSRPPAGTPVVSTLSPNTLATSDPPSEVLVQGSDFAPGDRVVFGGSTPPTSFHSDTELAVQVDPADWSAGVVQVLVGYTTRGPSNELPFTFT
jgi:hypothetical protein